ncbi:MAG: ABC transporter permease [Gammaproteobacteria bacterium]|nr:ABC transporter permease [Gammaproteobacteria bacterium]MCP5200535.1 ABC transporter permease [Gammaproteobacteria bacterium]
MSRARGLARLTGHPWLRGHRRALRAAVRHLRANLLANLTGITIMAVALALPATLLLLLEQHLALFEQWGAQPSLTVFMQHGAAPEATAAVVAALEARAGIEGVEHVAAAAAFAEFAASMGLDPAAFGDRNPLPEVLVVTLAQGTAGDGSAALVDWIRGQAAVDDVIVDIAWIERLGAITRLAERALAVVAVLLLGATVLVVGNTVRLVVQEHAAEIEVLKLVGATDAYVRRPFLYGGIVQGAIAGLGAVLLVELVVIALSGPVQALAAAYLSAFRLHGPGPGAMLGLVGTAALLGWAGAWLGTAHSLARLSSPVH